MGFSSGISQPLHLDPAYGDPCARYCLYPDCAAYHDERTYQCVNCDQWFCDEHGTRGGDRQIQDVGAVAYPRLSAGSAEGFVPTPIKVTVAPVDLAEIQKLARFIDGKIYSATGGTLRGLDISVVIPVGSVKGLPLYWSAMRTFSRAAWRALMP